MARSTVAWALLFALFVSVFGGACGLPVGNWAQRDNNGVVAMYTFEEGNGTFLFEALQSHEDLELNPNVVSWLPYSTGVSLSPDGTEFSIKTNGTTSLLAQTLSNTDAWAVEMWIEVEDSPDFAKILVSFGTCGMSTTFIPSSKTMNFRYNTDACYSDSITLPTFDTSQLHHLIVTSKKFQNNFFVDGQLITGEFRSEGSKLNIAEEILTIGRATSPGELSNLSGKIYMVAFYNTYVSQFQVTTNFNAGLPNQPPIVYDSEERTNEDEEVTITLNGTDPEGGNLSFVITTLPSPDFGWLYTMDGERINTTDEFKLDTSQLLFVPNRNVYTNRSGESGLSYRPVNFTFLAEEQGSGKRSRMIASVTIDIIEIPDPPITFDQTGIEIYDGEVIGLHIVGEPVDEYQEALSAGELLSVGPKPAGKLKNGSIDINDLPFNVSRTNDTAFSFELTPFRLQSVSHEEFTFSIRVYDTNGPSVENGTIAILIKNSLSALNNSEEGIAGGSTVDFELEYLDEDSERKSDGDIIKCFKIFDSSDTEFLGRLFVNSEKIEFSTTYCNNLNLTYEAPQQAMAGNETISFAIVLNYTVDGAEVIAESTPANLSFSYEPFVAPSSSEYVSSSSAVTSSSSATSSPDIDSSTQSTDSFMSSSSITPSFSSSESDPTSSSSSPSSFSSEHENETTSMDDSTHSGDSSGGSSYSSSDSGDNVSVANTPMVHEIALLLCVVLCVVFVL